MRGALALVAVAGLSACATAPRPAAVASLPAVGVVAVAETVPVGTAADDAADDPAIWRNAADPAASLIVATDKKAGLYVHGLDGKVRHFLPDGRLNNVDLVDMGPAGVIVVASDRNNLARAVLRVYRLDTAAGRLVPMGSVPGGAGEAYGVCLGLVGNAIHAFSVLKHGRIEEVAITLEGASPQGRIVRSRQLATQSEGCVVDPRNGTLYAGEELAGVWRFAAGETTGQLVAPADGGQLVADTEGMAILPQGADGGWLVVSSQGDNAYALYRLPAMTPAGRFRIVAGRLGATEETDGIALAGGDFGPDYPEGLFVAQDGINPPAAQNFKLVSWAAILAAINEGTGPQ
jgi:3-phytase